MSAFQALGAVDVFALERIRRVMLEFMTWPQIEALIERGFRRVIVPIGAIEQHGPRLPLVSDTLLASALAIRAAEELDWTLVAPVIRPGFSPHHMGFAGTITVGESLLVSEVRAYLVSLSAHGFDEFFLLSGHGGNFAPVRAAIDLLRVEMPPGTRIGHSLDLDAFATALMRPVLDEGLPATALHHADAAETSLAMFLAPSLVVDAEDRAGLLEDVSLQDLVDKGIRSFSPSGILGDPRGSNSALGQRVFESLTDYVVSAFRASVG